MPEVTRPPSPRLARRLLAALRIEVCPLCGALTPRWALSTHEAWHRSIGQA
ncbi:hypothetical protein [Pseudonocardia sp. NPDC049635]|uniref:hypothetical protein n=1 Tax=Pseudonocardia sp. NPDC049635 TaxID=3155506 RepID=UPI0033E55C22